MYFDLAKKGSVYRTDIDNFTIKSKQILNDAVGIKTLL